MVSEKPNVAAGRIVVADLGEVARSEARRPHVEQIEITDVRLRQAWPERIFRILVPIAGRDLRLRIR